ncbi:MAG: alpha/beta [Beijerinckiaceae bacterium]|nr:MAG: alpha/beta [Beijerinckiaceae bacterium]
MPLMPINGTELFVEEFGTGPETVLFYHSLFFSGEMYAPQIAMLRDKYRCVTIDWRGHGRSAAPLGGYDVDNLVRDALEVADAVGAKQFHWVGCSVGGVMGLRIAAQFGDRVKSLIVGGASAEAEPIEKVTRYEDLILDVFAKRPEAVIDRLMAILYGSPFLNDPARAADVRRERDIILSCGSARVARASAPVLRRVDIRHLLPHIRCPTLAICGALDGANPPYKSEIIAKGIPGARLEIMPAVGHQPNIEAPEAFGALIRGFLDEQTGVQA